MPEEDRVLPVEQPTDLEVQEVESEEEDKESAPGQYQIASYPADFTLEVLDKKLREGEIRIPSFQRGFVWKQYQSSRLIESFLVGLPVPPIFLFAQPSDQTFLVIDGQQRLKTIQYYFEGYFGPEMREATRTVFRLKGLPPSSPWAERTFSEISTADQRKLRNSVLRSLIVQQLDPKDDTSIYHIFERLNTGGTLLKTQEVRNAVYWGALNDMLKDLNTDTNWRTILGRPDPDSRQRDIELILRYFALLDSPGGYVRPMKDFMNHYMFRNRNPSRQFLDNHRSTFRNTCGKIVEALGPKPFHVWAGLNSAVFDSVTLAFTAHLSASNQGIQHKFQRLTDDPEYIALVRAHTTDEDVVRRRIAMANERLFSS